MTFDGNLDTLNSKKIGVVSTISYGEIFETKKPHLQLDRANNLEQSFNKLLKKRIDLVISDINVAEYTLKQLGLSDKVVRLQIRVESVPSYIAFSKKRDLTSLRDKFDLELRNMKQSGEYYKLLKQYKIYQQQQ
jgi:polar amino acid transport system substrate-binding protein